MKCPFASLYLFKLDIFVFQKEGRIFLSKHIIFQSNLWTFCYSKLGFVYMYGNIDSSDGLRGNATIQIGVRGGLEQDWVQTIKFSNNSGFFFIYFASNTQQT